VEVPSIIDEVTFQMAQERKKENKRILGKQRKYDYLIGGMAKCGHCGSSVSGMTFVNKKGQEYGYYMCNARKNPSRYGFMCEDGVSFRVSDVESVVWDWIKEILVDEKNLNAAIEKYQEEQQKKQSPILKLIEANKNKLTEIEAQKAKLIDGYTKGLFSLEDIAAKKVALDNQIVELREAIKSFESDPTSIQLTEEQISDIKEFAARVRRGLSKADNNFADRRKVLELLRMQVTLLVENGKKYADVECVLGAKRLEADYGTIGQYCC
jgi:site-specific DNA recombinase